MVAVVECVRDEGVSSGFRRAAFEVDEREHPRMGVGCHGGHPTGAQVRICGRPHLRTYVSRLAPSRTQLSWEIGFGGVGSWPGGHSGTSAARGGDTPGTYSAVV